jgi:hypothetical protein
MSKTSPSAPRPGKAKSAPPPAPMSKPDLKAQLAMAKALRTKKRAPKDADFEGDDANGEE